MKPTAKFGAMPSILKASTYLVGVVALGACKTLDAPDLNNSTLQGLTGGGATKVAVATAAQGLLLGLRLNVGAVVETFGMIGREELLLDASNPQSVPLDLVTGGDFGPWAAPYANDKLANVVLKATDGAVGMTDAEKESIRGFAKTMKALDLLYVTQSFDQSGVVLDVPDDPSSPPPPIVSKDQGYARILQLLDQAQTHLQAAGPTFAVQLPSGFANFTTPATFNQFNRAIKARVDVYTGNYPRALTDLQASFLNTASPLTLGVSHTYSTNSGNQTNGLYDPTAHQRYVHPSFETDAQKTAGGTSDLRFVNKVRALTPPVARFGYTAKWAFTIYNSPSAPVPIIRNEELILLRAEANLALGNTSLAIQDINFIRTTSGGLPAISDPYIPAAGQPATLLDELLYEKRYSLWWEGSHRWIDARRYGKLAQLPHDQPGQVVFPYARLPDLECNARNPQPAGCTQPAGL